MKYIKTYENIKYRYEPKIGDYVVCHEKLLDVNNNPMCGDIYDFTSNNIGEISFGRHENDDGITYDYRVKYDNIPESLLINFGEYYDRPMDRNEIVAWSDNKEDLEEFLSAKKYNL